MVTVEVIIRDEAGQLISERTTSMELGNGHLEAIEKAVEQWKQAVLPEMEADLLKKNKRRSLAARLAG